MGLERGFNTQIKRQVSASKRRLDAIWYVGSEAASLFTALGIESRGKEICIEHMSSGVRVRTLERFRNLVQEEYASRPHTFGVIFAYSEPGELVRKSYLIPCQTTGHYRGVRGRAGSKAGSGTGGTSRKGRKGGAKHSPPFRPAPSA